MNGDGLLGRYLYELLEDISKRAWTAAGRGVGTLLSRLLANILATRLVRGDQTVELRILVGVWERGAEVSGARAVEVAQDV